MKNQKNFIPVIIILLVLVGFVGVYYLGILKPNLADESPTTTPVVSISPSSIGTSKSATPNSTVNWKTYQNSTYNFSIKYPSTWKTWSQGSIKDAWQEISSPDLAPKGSQEPKIGMSVSMRVFELDHIAGKNDILHALGGAGVTGNYQVNIVKEDQNANVLGSTAIVGEYIGTDPAYAWHFWSQAVAKDKLVILVTITDFEEDKSLDSTILAPQILSTFNFTN